MYLANINADIENTINWCATCLEYHQTQPQEKAIQFEVLCKLYKVIGADIFFLKNKILHRLGTGLTSPATLLFNWPIRGLLPLINKEPININNDNVQYEALKVHQGKYVKNTDTCKDLLSFPIGSMVADQHKEGGQWIHGFIKEANKSGHTRRSYIIRMIEMAD